MAYNNADQIVVGGDGEVFVAPYGTALPTDLGTSIGQGLNAAFVSLGYTDEGGVTFGVAREIKEIRAWQSFAPLRKVPTSIAQKATFNLMEYDANTVPFAFGGGAITTTSNGFKYTPPAPSELNEYSMVIDVADGDVLHRIVIARGLVTDDVDTTFTREDASKLAIGFEALAQSLSDSAWAWYSNAEGFGGAS